MSAEMLPLVSDTPLPTDSAIRAARAVGKRLWHGAIVNVAKTPLVGTYADHTTWTGAGDSAA